MSQLYRLILVFCFSITCIHSAIAQTCNKRPYCKNIKSCKEALYYLDVCGFGKLDRDGDGVPCESICGRELTPVLQAMKNEIKSSNQNTAFGLIKQPLENFNCGKKRYCREMTSCREAMFI